MIDKKLADVILHFDPATPIEGCPCGECGDVRDYLARVANPGWAPDNPRLDEPTKCECGATAADPYCHCGC